MTSEAPPRRFPIGLTAATVIGLAILIALGVWQLQRLKWKEGLLAKVAAAQHASAQPLAMVLARAARGEDVEYQRVAAFCQPPPKDSVVVFQYALRGTQTAWRVITFCHTSVPPYDGILLDRGFDSALDGAMEPRMERFAGPAAVTGILRVVSGGGAKPVSVRDVTSLRVLNKVALDTIVRESGAKTAPRYFLAVDAESPAPPGLTPSALPPDIPNNHLSYAITWFGLAAALAGVYLAMLFRRPRAE
jgi:surfeit locus 1 family protein